MNRRQDTDIFGAKAEPVAPRIWNDTFVDPNAAFNKRMQNNFSQYMDKVQKNQENHFRNAITAQRIDSSKVNEDVDFDQSYHHLRKNQDMQSSIFYPPTVSNQSRVSMLSSNNAKTKDSQCIFDQNCNYGRKETLSRELQRFPQNSHHEFRGNSSRLFGLEDRISQETQRKGAPLIPHYMKWEDYDSIRYGGNKQESGSQNLICGSLVKQISINDISQSRSTLFDKQKLKPTQTKQNPQKIIDPMKSVIQSKMKGNFIKKKTQAPIVPVNNQNNQKKANQSTNGSTKGKTIKSEHGQEVQIIIVSGWNASLLEGLSKQCKLNSTQIVKFEQNGDCKATLYLKKSKRWQNVTDWLRKDAKLKIRVFNN